MAKAKAPAKTTTVYLDCAGVGLVEPAFEAATPADFLAEMTRYLDEHRAERETWVQLKDGGYVRWSSVHAIIERGPF